MGVIMLSYKAKIAHLSRIEKLRHERGMSIRDLLIRMDHWTNGYVPAESTYRRYLDPDRSNEWLSATSRYPEMVPLLYAALRAPMPHELDD
jgi:hypothetical protein